MADGPIQQWDDPLDARPAGDIPNRYASTRAAFQGGRIGWISYDFGRVFETIPTIALDDLCLPLFEFQYHDRVWTVDRSTDKSFRITASAPVKSKPMKVGSANIGEPALAGGTLASEITCNFTRATYTRAVQRVIDYIASGDIFQVNLSQRFSAPLQESPHEIYVRLQRQSGAVSARISATPIMRRFVIPPNFFYESRPIPNATNGGSSRARSKARARRPLEWNRNCVASKKDQAELNMIVDLERNDLGRICKIGRFA